MFIEKVSAALSVHPVTGAVLLVLISTAVLLFISVQILKPLWDEPPRPWRDIDNQ